MHLLMERSTCPPTRGTRLFRRSWHCLALAGSSTLGFSGIGAGPAAAAEPIHYIARLGDGVAALTNTGYSIGGTAEFTPEYNGIAWLGRPDGSLLTLGFRDDLHTADDGTRSSGIHAVNQGGVTIGQSDRFAGNEQHGMSAWVSDRHGNIVKIGYYDAAHTFPDGRKISLPRALNERNQLIGISVRGVSEAQTAWLATSVGHIRRIGLDDTKHRSVEGWSFAEPIALNNAGYVIGMSRYYHPAPPPFGWGWTTWLRTPWGSTRLIGFQSGRHLSQSGYYDGQVKFLTHSGYIAGESRRYRVGTDTANGSTAWLTRVDGPNRPIGLYDNAHQAPDGMAEAIVWDLNEAGIALGTSGQIVASGGNYRLEGRSAWLARPSGETIRVGLYDAEHTLLFNGRQWQVVAGVNEHNIAIGETNSYDPVTGFYQGGTTGRSAWVADLATGQTTRLGLRDAAHTRADGYRWSSPQDMSATRYVIGISYRYADARPDGSVPFTTWLYDRQSNQYIIINELPGTPAVFADSNVLLTYVDDSGLIIGYYNEWLPSVSSRGFIYELGGGFRHLDEAVDIDITDEGWTRFSQPRFVTPTGFIVGDGEYEGGGPNDRKVYFLRR